MFCVLQHVHAQKLKLLWALPRDLHLHKHHVKRCQLQEFQINYNSTYLYSHTTSDKVYDFFAAFGNRIITFKEPIPNKVLKGYVIGSERVPNEGSCRVNCYLNPDCVSINMGPLIEGELTCELNKATSGNEYSSHLEYQEDHTYLEIEVIRKNLHASSK